MTVDKFLEIGDVLIDPIGCWLWRGSVSRAQGSKGRSHHYYGNLLIWGRKHLAHRIAYHLFHRPLAKGEHVHHTCENRMCVNPAHLQAMTARAHSALHPRKRKATKCDGLKSTATLLAPL